MLTCRKRRIVVPAPAALKRLCAELRFQARRDLHRRLTHGLSAEQRKGLDALVQRREDTGQNWLTWPRRMPQAAALGDARPDRRLEHVAPSASRPAADTWYTGAVGPLAREAAPSRAARRRLRRQRRHATLVAIRLDLGAR